MDFHSIFTQYLITVVVYRCVSAISILLSSYLSILLEASDPLSLFTLSISLGVKLPPVFNAYNRSSKSLVSEMVCW